MMNKQEDTELDVISIWKDVRECNKLQRKYNTFTYIEAIGKYLLDMKTNNKELIKDFWYLEGLCDEAIITTQKKLDQHERKLQEANDTTQKEFESMSVKTIFNHKMALRDSKIWLKEKISELEHGVLPGKILKRLKWMGSRTQLIAGFDQLTKTSYREKPLLSAKKGDLINFINSRFIFKGIIPLNNNYNIIWNGEKHDLTWLFKEMHENKLVDNTKDEIAHFILDTFPNYSFSSVKKYLDGSVIKHKYNLQISTFK